jgi:hypothetical protein
VGGSGCMFWLSDIFGCDIDTRKFSVQRTHCEERFLHEILGLSLQKLRISSFYIWI